MAIKVGSQVRLIQPVVQGEVTAMGTDNASFGFIVRYTDSVGEERERFFAAELLEEVAS